MQVLAGEPNFISRMFTSWKNGRLSEKQLSLKFYETYSGRLQTSKVEKAVKYFYKAHHVRCCRGSCLHL